MKFQAFTVATLLAFSPMALAQSSSDSQPSGSPVGGIDITKCTAMMGAEREKCLREERSSASAGTTATTPGIATTTPAPLTTPSSPTNPTLLPGASTTPSGK